MTIVHIAKALLSRLQSDTSLKELIRDSGILYIAGILTIGLTFVQQITTANLLGSGDYGRLATILSSGALIMLILDVRTWELGTKLLARPILEQSYVEITRVVTWLIMVEIVLGIIGTLVLLVLARPIAAHLLKEPEFESLIRQYAISIPFRMFSLGVSVALLRLYDMFVWIAAKSIAYAVLRLVLMTGAALIGLGLAGVLAAVIIGEIMNMLTLLWMTLLIRRRKMPGVPLFDLRKPQQFASGFKIMGQLWITATLGGLHQHTFVPILALLTSPEQVGLFRVSTDIAELIDRLTAPLSIVIFPKVITSYERDPSETFMRFTKQLMWLLASLTLPMTLGIIIIGPLIFPHLLPDYKGVAIVAAILAIGYGINATFIWVRPAIVSLGLLREQNVLAVLLIGFSMFLLFIFVEDYGAVAGAISRGVFLSVYTLLSYLLLRHRQIRTNSHLSDEAISRSVNDSLIL